jgi:hypothetical protein
MIKNSGASLGDNYILGKWKEYNNKYKTLFSFGGGTSNSPLQIHDGGWTSHYDIKTYSQHQTGISMPTVVTPSGDTTFDDALHQIMYILSLNIIGDTCIHIVTDGG